MSKSTDDLLKFLIRVTAKGPIAGETLRNYVSAGRAGKKQIRAYNLCDGTRTQAEIAKSTGIDKGSFSRTVKRWDELGSSGESGTITICFTFIRWSKNGRAEQYNPRRGDSRATGDKKVNAGWPDAIGNVATRSRQGPWGQSKFDQPYVHEATEGDGRAQIQSFPKERMMVSDSDTLEELGRISRLLALLLTKNEEQGDAVTQLSRAGFTYAEIGELLGITPNAVKLRLRRRRKSTKRK